MRKIEAKHTKINRLQRKKKKKHCKRKSGDIPVAVTTGMKDTNSGFDRYYLSCNRPNELMINPSMEGCVISSAGSFFLFFCLFSPFRPSAGGFYFYHKEVTKHRILLRIAFSEKEKSSSIMLNTFAVFSKTQTHARTQTYAHVCTQAGHVSLKVHTSESWKMKTVIL